MYPRRRRRSRATDQIGTRSCRHARSSKPGTSTNTTVIWALSPEVELTVQAGITGLVGINGAGKTTLIRLMLGMTAPTSGHVAIFGTQVAKGAAGPPDQELLHGPEGSCLPRDQTAADFVAYAASNLAGIPSTEACRTGLQKETTPGGTTTSNDSLHRVLLDRHATSGMKLAQTIVHDLIAGAPLRARGGSRPRQGATRCCRSSTASASLV